MEDRVIIIGAGISGLVAAQGLAGRKRAISVLEARERIGGRIDTVVSAASQLPIELGAEFVHGSQHETWKYLRAAGLRADEVPDRHWLARKGEVQENPHFWEILSGVIERINTITPDQDFQSFADQAWSLDPEARVLMKEYVEGFHAAEADRMSVHALTQSEAAAEREQGQRQFRLAPGYFGLLEWIWQRLQKRNMSFHFGAVVKEIAWEPGRVEVRVSTQNHEEIFVGRCAVCTVPLSVLQNETSEGSIRFSPMLEKEKAIDGLAMGQICKVTLQFKERVWPIEDFGFIHSSDRSFPTWWSHPRGHMLTAWAGGPRARRLNAEPREAVQAEAVRSLAQLFKLGPQQIEDALLGWYYHNWQTDPFSQGAYSYTPARMTEMPRQLAQSVADTLFFAGEATDTEGGQGTVQGAIRSGHRVVEEVRHALRQKFVPAMQGLTRAKAA